MSQPMIAWSVLALVLLFVARGRRGFALAPLGGLLVLGALGLVAPAQLFSGFGHPALVTVVALSVVSEAITQSGVLTGMGSAIEGRIDTHTGQVLGLSLVAAGLSAFMSNAGAVAILLPTAVRMAGRAGVAPGRYAMPIALGAVAGGMLTLAGSAPNVIVSGFRLGAVGRSFGMFDYAPHGVAVILISVLLWLLFGRRILAAGSVPAGGAGQGQAAPATQGPLPVFQPFATRERLLCIGILTAAVVAVSLGVMPPSIGFATAALLMVLTGVIGAATAYRVVDLRLVIFLGSMLGLSHALQHTGAISQLVDPLAPLAAEWSRTAVLGLTFALACLLGNILGNVASAAIMAPIALTLGGAAGAAASVDSLLMAVAAGSCLAVVLPTHQAVVLAMSRAPFGVAELRKAGGALAVVGGLAAVLVIYAVWR